MEMTRRGFQTDGSMRLLAAALGVAGMVFGPAVHAQEKVEPQDAIPSQVCVVQDYGATGDGRTLDTRAIQRAIDDCAARGGGAVRLAGASKFISGPLVLRSRITLEIHAGTTLEGSTNHGDYPEIVQFKGKTLQGLLTATDAEYVAIEGGGTIDGRGESWWEHRGPGEERPRMIVFNHCRHVRMENVTVQNSPNWQIVPYRSEDVTFRNMRIYAPTPEGHNTDGIDPFSSMHVLIEHVTIDTGDDNVAIKSGEPGSEAREPSQDIVIRDCVFLHGHGLSIGSEVAGGVQHVHVERVEFRGTTAGIRMKSGRDRGADLSDFTYKDITMTDVVTPIQITDYYANGGSKEAAPTATPAPLTRLTPHFHNIRIENLKATGARTAMDIEGLPEAPITDLELRNVSIEAEKGAKVYYAQIVARGLKVKAAGGQPILVGAGAEIKGK